MMVSNTYARLISDYSVAFGITNTLPKTSQFGFIFIDYPSQFQIADQTLTCDTSTSLFSKVIVCNITRNRVFINGHTYNFEGDLIINLRGIMNPTYNGLSDNIFVRIYDGLNEKVIQRTYINLDPASFVYVYPGPLITINGNQQVHIERGTQTLDLYATVDDPCTLNLTLTPSVPGFSTIPYSLDLPVGAINSHFRVSVPMDFFEGTYTIKWTTLNDDIPIYYTPIEDTHVNVYSNTIQTLQIESLLDIPYYGQSLKTRFFVNNAPDIGFTIQLNLIALYRGMNLSTNTLNFSAGVNEQYLIISHYNQTYGYSVDADSGTIAMSIAGVN